MTSRIENRDSVMIALADPIEARLSAVQRQVDALTPSLLARAFSGHRVPQDPNDEPASASLERIREARAGSTNPKTILTK
jgi:type I restriction enzyme S subunit